MSRRETSTSEKTLATNRRARHLYHIDHQIECGIVLRGTEVKSLKSGQFAFTDCYARVYENELMLVGLHISPYSHATQFNHDPIRTRKLLVHRNEIRNLSKRVAERGLTLIPLRFYVNRGLVKVALGVCRGKKTFDKREDIKRRDLERELNREIHANQRRL